MAVVSVTNNAATALGLWDADSVYHVARAMGGTAVLVPSAASQQIVDLLSAAGSLSVVSSDEPVCVSVPSISGSVVVGQTLTADDGEWVGADSISRQWQVAGVDVVGATDTTYVPVTEDVEKLVSVVVTASNTEGSTSVESDTVGSVEEA